MLFINKTIHFEKKQHSTSHDGCGENKINFIFVVKINHKYDKGAWNG